MKRRNNWGSWTSRHETCLKYLKGYYREDVMDSAGLLCVVL